MCVWVCVYIYVCVCIYMCVCVYIYLSHFSAHLILKEYYNQLYFIFLQSGKNEDFQCKTPKTIPISEQINISSFPSF